MTLSSRPWRCVWVEVKLHIPFLLVLESASSDSSTSHLIPREDSFTFCVFLFDRWLVETHSLSGSNDEKNNLSPSRESGTDGSIRCPVQMLTEYSTSDMWIYCFYTALFGRVHFPITYSIIIIIIIVVFLIVLIIWTPLIRFIRALYSVRKFYVVNFTHKETTPSVHSAWNWYL